MDISEDTIYQLRQLLAKSLDGSIVQEEVVRLNALLEQDGRFRRYYLEYIYLHIGLRRLHQEPVSYVDTCENNILDQSLWEELARNERTAQAIQIESPRPAEKPSVDASDGGAPSPRINKSSLYTIILSVAAMVLAIVYFQLVPPPAPIVATLSDAIGAHWAESDSEVRIGDDIRSEPRVLISGIVTLKFDSGAEAVVEGPAEFTPLSASRMRLTAGKIFAHVPDTAIGFTIDTPVSSVVDLGTEFGVHVDPRALGTEVHVYDGKVNLVAGLSGQPKQSEILQQAEARQIDASGGQIKTAAFQELYFVRKISSKDNRIWYGPPVSLASFVAGGDGRTPGDQPSGIDPATGRIHQTVREELGRMGSGTYSVVTERVFVDGVFVPNGPCAVSSAGHTFEGFPITTGTFWSDITASPVFNFTATNEAGEILYRQQFIATLDSKSDVNTESAKPMILMHANSGITFDLNKIRDAFTNAAIVGFRADCGVTKNAMVKMRHDFWVLLDGQQVFHYSQAAGDDTAQTICIPIRPDQSFLTLATTDGGDNTSYDWCIFENAVLELAPKGLQ